MGLDTPLRRVWPERESADANLLRAVVRNTRRKLGASASDPARIFNRRGVGRRMPKPGEG